ncbi:uncharacterized protein LOC131933856 [Physella acuta]|uniref:uncharacterized protein LOC131933856 n=1 Tax=Physella acuta TaxID=109671 RepID=UPI0027DCDE66|nr:uncharacterized protein LOC131933856 [Physella acuta]
MRLAGMSLYDTATDALSLNSSTQPPLNVTILVELNDIMFRRLAPAIAVFIALMVVGVVGNVFVCYIFLKKLRRSTQNFLLLCLGVFDLLSTCVGIPSEIWDMRHYYLYDSSPWACKAMRFLTTLPSFASILVLMVIAVDRYRKVCKPLHQQIQVSWAKTSIIIILVVSLVFSVPALYIYGHRTFPSGVEGVNGRDCSVDDYFIGKSYPLVYESVLASLFVILAIILTSLYIRIWMETRRHRKYMKTHAVMGTVLMEDSAYNSSTNYDSSTDNLPDNFKPSSKRSSNSSNYKRGFLKRAKYRRYRSKSQDSACSRGRAEKRPSCPSKPDEDNDSNQPRSKWVIGNETPVKRNSADMSDEGLDAHAISNGVSNGFHDHPDGKGCETMRSSLRRSVKNHEKRDTNGGDKELIVIPEGVQLNLTLTNNQQNTSDFVIKPESIPVKQTGISASRNDTKHRSSFKNGTNDPLPGTKNSEFSRINSESGDCDVMHGDNGREKYSRKSSETLEDCAGLKKQDARPVDGMKPNRVSFVNKSGDELDSDAELKEPHADEEAVFQPILSQEKITANGTRLNGSVSTLGSLPLDLGSNTHRVLKHSKSTQSLTAKRVKKALRATRTTVIASVITLGFILSYLPHLILVILRSVKIDFEHHLGDVSLIFYNILLRSYFANNVINIFVYGSMNLEFRSQLLKLWTNMQHPCHKHHAPETVSRRNTLAGAPIYPDPPEIVPGFKQFEATHLLDESNCVQILKETSC